MADYSSPRKVYEWESRYSYVTSGEGHSCFRCGALVSSQRFEVHDKWHDKFK